MASLLIVMGSILLMELLFIRFPDVLNMIKSGYIWIRTHIVKFFRSKNAQD